MEDGAALDAVALPRLLVVSVFGDTRGGDDCTVHFDVCMEGTILYVQGDEGIS